MIALVEARHYKCLRSISQKLSNFQILIGPNASGKSTFLDVIAFFGDLLRNDTQRVVRKRAQTLRELVWKQERDSFELAVVLKLPSHFSHPFARYEVRVGATEKGIQLLLENLWLLSGMENRSQPRQGTIFPQEPDDIKPIIREPRRQAPKGWRRVVVRMPDSRVYFRSETSGWNAPFSLPFVKAGLAYLPEDTERFPSALWVRRVLMEGVQFLQLNSVAMRQPCPPDAPQRFQPDGSNLPIVVRELKVKHPDRFQRWMNHVRMTLPDLDEIEVQERPQDRYLQLVAKFRTGVRLPQWLLSDGTLRFLALTVLAYIPEEGSIYLIEEPENGLHPRAVEGVFQSLSSAYDIQVLVATHSPIFLSLASPEHLLCFAQTESGATDIISGKDHPKLKEWHGEVNLSTLFAAGVLG